MKLRIARKVEHLHTANIIYFCFNGEQFIRYRVSTRRKAQKRLKQAWTRRMR